MLKTGFACLRRLRRYRLPQFRFGHRTGGGRDLSALNSMWTAMKCYNALGTDTVMCCRYCADADGPVVSREICTLQQPFVSHRPSTLQKSQPLHLKQHESEDRTSSFGYEYELRRCRRKRINGPRVNTDKACTDNSACRQDHGFNYYCFVGNTVLRYWLRRSG